MDDMAKRMAAAVRGAKPCKEHGEEKCLYGCSHVRPDECDACALNMANAAVDVARGIIDVWMCPGCRMVGALVRRINEVPHEFVARAGVQHSEFSPGCDVESIRFRAFVPGAVTGDKIIWAPVERAQTP